MSRAQLTSTDQQNSGGPVSPFVAGKNKIINGDFGVWQRGTSFSNPAAGTYTADRFVVWHDGSGATRTISQQAFTPGTAPVTGYEGSYFFRYDVSAVGTGNTYQNIEYPIENVRTLAGQTATISFWAKAASSRNLSFIFAQQFGSGGSSDVTFGSTTVALTTSWQRFTTTVSVPSIAGKTIGGNTNQLHIYFQLGALSGITTIDLWGVQVEAGSVATPFTTASGTLQGELALCQRYYWRMGGDSPYQFFASGIFTTTTNLRALFTNPVPMRSAPSSIDFSTYTNYWTSDGNYNYTPTGAFTIDRASSYVTDVNIPTSGATTPRAGQLFAQNSTSAYIGFSAEL